MLSSSMQLPRCRTKTINHKTGNCPSPTNPWGPQLHSACGQIYEATSCFLQKQVTALSSSGTALLLFKGLLSRSLSLCDIILCRITEQKVLLVNSDICAKQETLCHTFMSRSFWQTQIPPEDLVRSHTTAFQHLQHHGLVPSPNSTAGDLWPRK